MPIVSQDKLTATNTGVTFEESLVGAKRIQHNTVDIMSLVLSGISTPCTLTYYQTNGSKKLSYIVYTPNCIDLYYDRYSDKYYALGFKESVNYEDTVITSGTESTILASGLTVDPDDDFSLPAGTYLFDSNRWTEGESSSFLKDSGQLVYYTTAGQGSLTSKTEISGTLNINLDFSQTTMGGTLDTFFGVDLLNKETGSLEYGVGITSSGGSDKYHCAVVSDINNFTNGATLEEVVPNYYGLPIGTTDYTITYTGVSSPYVVVIGGNPAWKIDQLWRFASPTATGTITVPILATSGTEGISQNIDAVGSGSGSNSGLSVELYSIGAAVINDFLEITVEHLADSRGSTTGTINLQRVGTLYSSSNSVLFSKTIGDGDNIYAKIYGRNSSPVELRADNFTVVSGYAEEVVEVKRTDTYRDEYVNSITYPVFDLDRIYANGLIRTHLANNLMFPEELFYSTVHTHNSDVVTTSGIAGTSGVELSHTTIVTTTTSTSGTNLSTYSAASGNSVSFCVDDSGRGYFILGTNVYDMLLPSTTVTGYISPLTPGYDGHVNSGIAYSGQPYFYNSTSGGFLQTTTVDLLSQVVVRTLDATLPASGSERATYLDMSNYNTWLHNPDNSSMLYVEPSSRVLYQFNIDPDISAFSAVNTSDFNLRAGKSDPATITTEVINCWGDPLYGKNVNMEIIAGDGVISPPSAITNISGTASGTYTAGATVGAVQIQVTISD